MGTVFQLLKCLRTHKTHLKLRKNKNGLRLLHYAKPRVVVQLTLTKIIKIVANRWRILWLKCTKFDFDWGSAPDPAEGAYSAPRPLAVFGGLLLREKEGRGGKGRGREGRGREERGGEGGSSVPIVPVLRNDHWYVWTVEGESSVRRER